MSDTPQAPEGTGQPAIGPVLRLGFMPVSLGLIAAAAAVVPLPYVLERPGTPVMTRDIVVIADPAAGDIEGDYLLTTVAVDDQVALVDLVTSLATDDVRRVPADAFLPPGARLSEHLAEQAALFEIAGDIAAAVALQAAGYPVDPSPASGDGALIRDVVVGSAADGLLRIGDVVVAAAGQPIETAQDLRDAVADAPAGAAIELRVRREGSELTVLVTPVATGGSPGPILGVNPQTLHPRLALPVDVQLRSRAIGGPSAGLVVALTVYDRLKPDVDLAGGRIVAATGELDGEGRVGGVGGVDLKALAAARAGADVFLVPADQEDQALRALPAGSDLQVVGVATFDEALDALRRGGA